MNKIIYTLLLIMFLTSCASQKNCGSKSKKRSEHRKTKSMVAPGWVQ